MEYALRNLESCNYINCSGIFINFIRVAVRGFNSIWNFLKHSCVPIAV